MPRDGARLAIRQLPLTCYIRLPPRFHVTISMFLPCQRCRRFARRYVSRRGAPHYARRDKDVYAVDARYADARQRRRHCALLQQRSFARYAAAKPVADFAAAFSFLRFQLFIFIISPPFRRIDAAAIDASHCCRRHCRRRLFRLLTPPCLHMPAATPPLLSLSFRCQMLLPFRLLFSPLLSLLMPRRQPPDTISLFSPLAIADFAAARYIIFDYFADVIITLLTLLMPLDMLTSLAD